MLPTSIRGRLWKLGFEGPDPTFAGFLVIPKGSEVDFQVPPVGILGIPWNIQNRQPSLQNGSRAMIFEAI